MARRLTRLWLLFCRAVVKVFYRRCEVAGLENVPRDGPVLLCANHTNALVDVVVLQSACPRVLHPLARSGLFGNPILLPVLRLLQAVPIYRRQDSGGADTVTRNDASFRRCFELFAQGGALLIFPEGQSHVDPHLHELRTGAARLALGAVRANGAMPAIVPAGLVFTRRGRFRGDVVVEFGPAVACQPAGDVDDEQAVRALTARIRDGLAGVTINVSSWEDIDLVRRLERFFALRGGRYRRGDLRNRMRAYRRLIRAQTRLRQLDPDAIRRVRWLLRRFERLCRRFGVRDYHLTVRYRWTVVARFVLRALAGVVVLLPLAAWGALNSLAPFLLTRHVARWAARGVDQYDTAKILTGMVCFPLFWSAQAWLVREYAGVTAAAVYLASLPLTGALALLMRRERRRILENVRAFVLFLRKRGLREHLLARRVELERELARLVRLARRQARRDNRGSAERSLPKPSAPDDRGT